MYNLAIKRLSMFLAYFAWYVVRAMQRSSRKCEECVGCLVKSDKFR